MNNNHPNPHVEHIEMLLRDADKKVCELHAWLLFLRQRNAVKRKRCFSDLQVIHKIKQSLLRADALLRCLRGVPISFGEWVSPEERDEANAANAEFRKGTIND